MTQSTEFMYVHASFARRLICSSCQAARMASERRFADRHMGKLCTAFGGKAQFPRGALNYEAIKRLRKRFAPRPAAAVRGASRIDPLLSMKTKDAPEEHCKREVLFSFTTSLAVSGRSTTQNATAVWLWCRAPAAAERMTLYNAHNMVAKPDIWRLL